MKTKKMALLVLACFVSLTVPAVAAEKVIEIKHLGVSPWLGKYETNQELATKFASEKANLAQFIQFDLKRSAGLDMAWEDVQAVVGSMEADISSAEPMVHNDGKQFLSMGWKDRHGKIQRTDKIVLKRGKDTKGLSLKGEARDYEIVYFFPFDCGNPMLDAANKMPQPKAEAVPPPRIEAPAVAQAPAPPVVVAQPPPPPQSEPIWVRPAMPQMDMCPNIEGMQTTVPEGWVYDSDGNCVPSVRYTTVYVPSYVPAPVYVPSGGGGYYYYSSGGDIFRSRGSDYIFLIRSCPLCL